MAYEKFGQDRHQPDGVWVQATHLTEVVGIQYRKKAGLEFCDAVKASEKKGAPYGLMLERQPNNPHDANAIAVIGVATVFPWIGKPKQKEWHIGFVPKEIAADVVPHLIDQSIPVGVEMHSIYKRGDYCEIKFFVLAPKGHGVKTRQKHQSA